MTDTADPAPNEAPSSPGGAEAPDRMAKEAAAHGLTHEEYDTLLVVMGREPTLTELGIFSVMWSEHCSYKSSRRWLRTLPTKAPQVIQGPGENAGVVDIGNGLAAVFKIESHNHPSFIEPFEGAATGVGGILRDVFTMGARPVASLNALRFGDPDHPRTRYLLSGVVAGIGSYGNCVGVPTVGGEVNFDASYNGNILVNAMTVGIAEADRIFYSHAAGPGNAVVYVGSKTGRDGIHGATMASAEFSGKSDEKRPTVQVGDPFTEKLLLEACLELMATDAIVAIQDMGAAGLTSSSVEMANKGGVGIDLDIDAVPRREHGMTAYEVMLSESQERMLMVLRQGSEETARRIFEKWDLDFAIVGQVTDSGRLRVHEDGAVVADIPVTSLAESSPEYDRPWTPTPPPIVLAPDAIVSTVSGAGGAPLDCSDALRRLLDSPHLCSRRWIWEQYDHSVMADTVAPPGGDAGVVRVHGTVKGLAVTTDCTPRYCLADPETGGRQAVAEAWRNLVAVGATPLALTNNLNFGNPEKPEVMGQFVGCVQGIGDAARALAFPVISGNVSLYNETGNVAIAPTPVIGGVGLIEDVAATVGTGLADDQTIVLIGETTGWLGCSLYQQIFCGGAAGAPPPVDLEAERRNGAFVSERILAGDVAACHDLSDGGLLASLAEMALAGGVGARIEMPGTEKPGSGESGSWKLGGAESGDDLPLHAWLFGEDQARYLCAVADPKTFLAEAVKAGIPTRVIGRSGGDSLQIGDSVAISVGEMRALHEGWLPAYTGAAG